MPDSLPLYPESASTVAGSVDALFWTWVAISAFFSLLIAVAIFYFFIRYQRRRPGEIGHDDEGSMKLEIAWSAIPLVIALAMFGWGTKVFFTQSRPPADAVEYFATGKQWMWKIQHPSGRREINELHVPVGRPIKLTMISEDVIHSFFVPAFRVKADVLPGRYTTLWFEATKPGEYHLFCAEYCGTEHSLMGGTVYVMEPDEYEAWLAREAVPGGGAAASGEQLFTALACETCHRTGSRARGPDLIGVFGSRVELADGSTVVADETYLRESILNPAAKVVRGYQPLMPSFQGQVSEDQLLQLIQHIKSLGPRAGQPGGGASGEATGGGAP
ncbi:MAG TPA: cytochrome c oxidase subunit II [Thermoanaerobaculia bacterium]|nr:cytochrome c oxidase subunit II [Thermoanaerobaculia bacterium]